MVELVRSVVTLGVAEVTDVGNTVTDVGGAGIEVEVETEFEVMLTEVDVMFIEDEVMLTEEGVTAFEALILVWFNEEFEAMAEVSKTKSKRSL